MTNTAATTTRKVTNMTSGATHYVDDSTGTPLLQCSRKPCTARQWEILTEDEAKRYGVTCSKCDGTRWGR